jgi:predicted ATPase
VSSGARAKRVVLTGGPGAGKTAVLELTRLHVCEHVAVLPEAASMLFRGGFPRSQASDARRAAQRAIFRVQYEIESATEHARPEIQVLLCDRGTVDGAAYWPAGDDTLWSAVGTTHEAELARYDAVIHLRTPQNGGYNQQNPMRIESVEEAARIDARIAALWQGHARYQLVSSTEDFVPKAEHALALLFDELPRCCQRSERARERIARRRLAPQ